MHFLRFVFFALLSFPLLAQEIQYTSSWRAFLTGAESTVKLQCPGDEVSLEIHYEHRRLASVTQRVDGEETTLTFTLPEMKAGVRLPAELRIEARSKGKAIATLRQPIGLYSPAPLAQRVTWAESLQIRLLDPDLDSAGALDSIALPSTRFTNSRGLLDEPGLIILAEGLNLDVYRYLTKDLIAACRGDLIAVKCRLEVKAVNPKTDEVVAIDRQNAVTVDLTEQIAGKSSLQMAAAEIAARMLPKIVR